MESLSVCWVVLPQQQQQQLNNNFISNTRQQVKLQLKLSKSERNYKLQWANGQTWAEYTICFSRYCCCCCCSCSIRMRFAYVRGQNKSLWPQQLLQQTALTQATTTTDTAKCLLWSKATSSRCAFVMQLSCLSPVPPLSYPLAVTPPPCATPLDTVTVSGHHTANVIFETFQCV